MSVERKATKPVNMSDDFQVYDGTKLLGSFKTVQEARRFLMQCGYSAALVYPRAEIERENASTRGV